MFKETNYNTFEFKTKNFTISYSVVDTEDSFDTITEYWDEKDANDFAKKYENGELLCFTAWISVIDNESGDTISETSLSNCIYENYIDFIDFKGTGYYATLQNLKKETDPEQKNYYQNILNNFKNKGHSGFGSYAKDLISEVLDEVRESEYYEKFKLAKKVKHF